MHARTGGFDKRLLLLALLLGAGHSQAFSAQAGSPQIRRTPAPVMDTSGAPWLVRPEREEEERPEQLLQALKIQPGDVVADVGAGVGYFSLRLARLVGKTGKVLAVDIQQAMLDELARSRDREGLQNIETILGTETDPKLLPDSVDLVLLVDVYHEFSQPAAMMENTGRPETHLARLVLVELPGRGSVGPHQAAAQDDRAASPGRDRPDGLSPSQDPGFSARQHIIIFEKQRM
jgi:SAM-dependent methyltransferase